MLHVRVIDSCTREPIPQALVTLTPGPSPMPTNDGGNVFFGDLRLGTYVVSLSADGYQTIGGDLSGGGGIPVTIGAAGDPSADVVQLPVEMTALDAPPGCVAGSAP